MSKTVQKSMRLDSDLVGIIKKTAKEENRTFSNMVDTLLRAALENKKI